MERLLIKTAVGMIRGYQAVFDGLRVFFGWQSYCSFSPSCSSYMIDSLETLGFLKGSVRGLTRILSCHPLSRGGWDPVPRSDAK